MQALKAVRASAATHLRDISEALTEFAESADTAERRKEFVDGCAALEKVDPSVSRHNSCYCRQRSLDLIFKLHS